MAWRVHLSNQAIPYLDILSGKPLLLAVWTRRDRVAFYALESGVNYGESEFEPPEDDDLNAAEWGVFLKGLVAPNDTPLAFVRTRQAYIFTAPDGQRLFLTGEPALWLAKADGRLRSLTIPTVSGLVAAAFWGAALLSAALDSAGTLHVFRNTSYNGTFETELDLDFEHVPHLLIAGEAHIYATDGTHMIRMGADGTVFSRREVHYPIGRFACSENGLYVVTSDSETGVIRVYSGDDFTPLYQKFSIDLVAASRQLQLLADLPPIKVAPSALAVGTQGEVAFALSGVVCVSHVDEMEEVPRPHALETD